MSRHRSTFRPIAAVALLVLTAVGAAPGTVGATTSPAGDVGVAAASAGCGKTPMLTSGTHTIQSGGNNRSLILKIPDNYDNSYPHRLAFGFHWWGGTAEDVASGGTDGYPWAYYGMQSQSGDTTIFVAPQGIDNGWANSNGEDVTFTDDMVRLIEDDLCVDTTQLFSVGFSYGGAMSYALACARANVFRAVAAIAAPGPISGCDGGTQPIAYLGIHGVSDTIQNGRALRDRFVANNGCTPQNPPEPAAGSLTHISTEYSGCTAGYPVVWAAFDGGHQQGPVDGCAGCESGARSWVKPELWRFFTQFGTDQPPPTAAGTGPCDIYAAGGTPCVAAHSTVRALYGSYDGNLYQVRRASDDTTSDIGLLAVGGAADAATQDSFCAGTTCVITVVYDQSGHGNDLWYQGSSQVPGSSQSRPANATSESLTIGGSNAYSLYINPSNSYWRDGHLTGVPTGTAPEGMYMVTSGTHVNGGCCFDYGNSETTRSADAAGAMDAINFSTQCWFGGCSGSGPWVQADLEWGLYSGGSQSWNPNQRAFPNRFVTATLKNDGTSRFAMKGSDAQSGSLTTLWDGSLPPGYSPMKKQGAIVLGSGGDCCKPGGGANLSAGTFYEGAMVAGYPSDATENAVQANVVAAGYGSGDTGSNQQWAVGQP